MAKFNVSGAKVGDRVRIKEGHHGAGVTFTASKVTNYITHSVEGNTDSGSFVNVPLHWVEVVERGG